MVELIRAVNGAVNNFIWGVPAMVCILGVGLLLSVRTGFLQIRRFPYAIRTTIGRMFKKKSAADGGEVYFKTDDEGLFNDSLAYFPEAGFEITWQTRDLHADEPAWNIRTEHEAMFTEQGIKTKALIARKLPLENEQQALAEAIAKRTAIEKAESAAWRAEHGEG